LTSAVERSLLALTRRTGGAALEDTGDLEPAVVVDDEHVVANVGFHGSPRYLS
jgi:hypothetical protein